MDPRATQTLAWFDSRSLDVSDHPGAAFAEVEVLRQLVDEAAPPARSVLATAYRRDLERGAPQFGDERSDARALAHVVMFATDFGRDRLDLGHLFGARLEALASQHVEDTDTLGEILIACHCLSFTSPSIVAAREAFDVMWADEDRLFSNYHIVLVGALLYAITG